MTRQPTEPTTETIANADEVRRNIRRSLSEPRQPTEPTTETIANADTYDLSTYFEAKWDGRAIQLMEAERKQTLLTLFSKLENSLINDLNLMKADIGTMKADIGTMKADIGTMKRQIRSNINQLKTEIITEFRNMLQQHFDDLIHQKIKNSEGRHWDNEETDKIQHKSTENRDYYGVSKYVATTF
ncbi:hypothetical protein QE152_g25788 [Popillia japonica]|uniref:Uncharacterized protein n=1 Tax=Popillia japonica TaxID=7064 RepID=A0AAW1JZ68_POPJA